MTDVKPIRPDEVSAVKQKQIPSVVFQAFNELIAKNYSSGSSTVRQDAVAERILMLYNEQHNEHILNSDIYDNNWLDVENAYREAGWHVYYDKPGFNESYPATFTFRKGNKGKT